MRPERGLRVFISHASEDKIEYGIPLAKALLADGIDVWLDLWAITPGDSLVEKIFQEGISSSTTVVFLMTPTSVGKPWVIAELENAVVRHINGELRVIPVLLQPCEVPQSLRAIAWISLTREGSIDKVARAVSKAVHKTT